MNFRRILLPTDFSDFSRAAEQSACELAGESGAELHVLHVLSDIFLSVPQTAAAIMIPPKVLENQVTDAEREIANVPPDSWAKGRNVVRAVRIGSVYETIVQYARDHDVDLIVIGTHGRTGLRHILLGSVAERVVRLSPCSVLTVRPTRPARVKEGVSPQPALKTA